MHSLLERQLRRAGFTPDDLPTDPTVWREFLSRIERSYANADHERELLKRHPTESTENVVANTIANPMNIEQMPLLHNMAFSLSSGLCIFDIQGQPLFINPAAQHYFEIQDTSTPTAKILEYFELHDISINKPFVVDDLLKRLAKGHAFYDHNACLQQTHRKLPVSCVFDPIIVDQEIKQFTLLFEDISDLKNIETELITAKESAEKASQAKSQFLSSMSHELRTPMNAILGYGELLKDDLNTPLNELDDDYIVDMRQYVSNILQAGWHLLELINKVLDLTRIEAGKLEISIQEVELIDLIKECVDLILPLAEKRSIKITNETISLPPHFALVDRGRLKQVLINLLSNAVKYNKEQGIITIQLIQPKVECVQLTIIDTGIGLTAEQKDKIFEPFTRVSGLNLIEGTGIGLTITKRLLEMMDARINVESESGVGSRFQVELPTGQIDNMGLDAAQTHRKHLLLYVEDSRTNVSLVAQILKARPDIALMSAQTGEMGLELAHLHHPDIILLDINLPGMDGFEVLENLRQTTDTQYIPVLALSANDTAHNLERSRQVGFLSYIIKPLDIKKFLTAIDQALETSKETKKITL
ncbi:ATP-binding protein [Beggiatoa leptomitoformis]|uniref:histidine kinase n=1 Tax=Beggiatoa leptomitoformis TaxID=288004 RepID=A0A2N9YC45_9GAMM|nr:ATP-binding protein [Beggiatoa leptomitoformis]AUI68012.1 response regulator [Beggiatoa leptomitoformis]QGX03470.1 response regulator [Beggiatoa leptomitoformis]